MGPTNRLDDGIDLPCMKIGENDELAQWHLRRCQKKTRAPMYYLLDERTRLAGCHMIREAVERVTLEEGIDRFKQFSREVIEEGRRSFKSRIREMTVPGRYRSAATFDVTFADKQGLPARARRDFLMHAPFEVRIGGDGTYELDMEGASAWGWHSMNCTPSGMQGAIWVQFTQTLICNDKVNDGAYLAIGTNFPEGTIANLGDAEGSTGIAWAFLQPAFTGFPRTLSRALQSRGFIEEVIGSYSCSGNVIQGGGIDQYGNSSAIMNFEIAAQGMGGKYVLDGTDTCAAMFNPEGDAGDVEMWELICPMVYLSRRIKASSGGPGRHRGGSSFESLLVVWKTPFWELQNLGTTRVFSAQGLFGGYPGSAAYVHNIKGADLLERAWKGEAYPLCDGDWDHPALFEIEGERTYKQDNFTTLEPFAQGDLYLSVMKGAPGLGDPLLRPPEAVAADVREGHLLPRFTDSVYGVALDADGGADVAGSAAGRERIRRERLARSVPVREWWAGQRRASTESAGLDRAGEDLLRGVDAAVGDASRPSSGAFGTFPGSADSRDRDADGCGRGEPDPGRSRPPQTARTVPGETSGRGRRLEASRGAAGRDAGSRDAEQRCSTRSLSRREVKDIQSGYKDPDRFEKWVTVLAGASSLTTSRSCCPMGEGLNWSPNCARDAEELGRSGSDYRPRLLPTRPATGRWRAAIYVRDDLDKLLGEVYPKSPTATPEWMELRELYCPSCQARQLEDRGGPAGLPGTSMRSCPTSRASTTVGSAARSRKRPARGQAAGCRVQLAPIRPFRRGASGRRLRVSPPGKVEALAVPRLTS